MLTDTQPGTTADRLRLMGFELSFQVDRLPIVITDEEGNEFVTSTKLTASPVRGDAKRQFGVKGQVAGEAKSNVRIEQFGAEKDQGRTELRDVYLERCAQSILEFLRDTKPGLKVPGGQG